MRLDEILITAERALLLLRKPVAEALSVVKRGGLLASIARERCNETSIV
jgi:hypothetical protein